MSSFIQAVTKAITSYFSLFDSDDNEDKNIESDMLYPVDIENVTNRNDGIQVLKESDVDIVDDIKQRVPFAPVPSRENMGMQWCVEKQEFIYLKDTNSSEDFLNRIREINIEEQKEEHVSEDSNISEITTDACVGSPSDPPGLSFEDIGEDMNDSLFVKNVWANCKL